MEFVEPLRKVVNLHYQGYEPYQIVLEVAIGCLIIYLVKSYSSGLKDGTLKFVFRALKSIPQVQEKINQEKQKVKDKLARTLEIPGTKYLKMPEEGLSADEILKVMEDYRREDEKHWKTGKISGGVYTKSDAHMQLVNKSYSMFSYANPLHPDLFKSVRKFEIEVLRMTAEMMNGDDEVCGIMTSGGTESILMACKSYRDRASVPDPEIIVPITAHAAFDKAAQYFKIKLVHIPVDPKTQQPNPADYKKAITKNTVLMVGSAPQFPHGIIDPIEKLSNIAKEHGIPFHVDSCLGGFLLPWLNRAGPQYGVPVFDFRLPGVTSISVDTHKYGMTNKGSSVLLFRNEEYRRFMYFCITDWPGGVYASPAMAGSRPGGVIASAWASLIAIGKKGYTEAAIKIWETAQLIKKGVQEIPDLELVGDSFSSVVAFASKSKNFDVFKVSDAMKRKGWNLNALQRPSAIHICITNASAGMGEEFIKDLKESVQMVKEKPEGFPEGTAPIYGMTASLPDRSLIGEIGLAFLDGVFAKTH